MRGSRTLTIAYCLITIAYLSVSFNVTDLTI